ncbi:hypothetical protein RFI_15245, partial [Reticulomyxa filosa]
IFKQKKKLLIVRLCGLDNLFNLSSLLKILWLFKISSYKYSFHKLIDELFIISFGNALMAAKELSHVDTDYLAMEEKENDDSTNENVKPGKEKEKEHLGVNFPRIAGIVVLTFVIVVMQKK